MVAQLTNEGNSGIDISADVCTYISNYLSTWLPWYLSLCYLLSNLFIYPSVHLWMYLPKCVCLSIALFVAMSIILTIYHLSAYRYNLSMCLYGYLSIYLSMYLCIYLSIYLSRHLCIYLSICLRNSVSIYLAIRLCIYLLTCLSINLCVHLFGYRFEYLFIDLLIYLS